MRELVLDTCIAPSYDYEGQYIKEEKTAKKKSSINILLAFSRNLDAPTYVTSAGSCVKLHTLMIFSSERSYRFFHTKLHIAVTIDPQLFLSRLELSGIFKWSNCHGI